MNKSFTFAYRIIAFLVLAASVFTITSCQKEADKQMQPALATVALDQKLANDADFRHLYTTASTFAQASMQQMEGLSAVEREAYVVELEKLVAGPSTDQNVAAIAKTLGFTSTDEFMKMSVQLAKQQKTLSDKYPQLATMTPSAKQSLFIKVEASWHTEDHKSAATTNACAGCKQIKDGCRQQAFGVYAAAIAALKGCGVLVAPPLIAGCVAVGAGLATVALNGALNICEGNYSICVANNCR